MELMGMDQSRLREFREITDQFFRSQNNPEKLGQLTGQIIGIMTEYIEQKRQTPDEGLISYLLTVQIDGRPITLEELQNMCLLLFVGGMDTVANATGFIYDYLAGDPALQQQLVDNPSRCGDFAEEGLRLYGVIFTPRIVARDCEKFGLTFKKDDMVLCMLPLGGRDERVNANPGVFDLDRKKRELLTFSRGPHLCVGHFLARAEIRILTEEWIKQIPHFRRKPGTTQQYKASTGLSLVDLPIEW
jgi:cytochrome P450